MHSAMRWRTCRLSSNSLAADAWKRLQPQRLKTSRSKGLDAHQWRDGGLSYAEISLDGQKGQCRKLLDQAMLIARAADAEVEVIYVVDDRSPFMEGF